MGNKFQHELGDTVTLSESDETGVVIGRSERLNCEPSYCVIYKAADGRQTECWWQESAIKA